MDVICNRSNNIDNPYIIFYMLYRARFRNLGALGARLEVDIIFRLNIIFSKTTWLAKYGLKIFILKYQNNNNKKIAVIH